jgi:hypothetical protein
MADDDLETRALAFARRAHESIGQKRKYSGEPYMVHPVAVAEIVRSVPHTREMIAAVSRRWRARAFTAFFISHYDFGSCLSYYRLILEEEYQIIG